ncbi:MAG TPA: hypothetical protein PKD85_02975 [Saprospiraceae bacterium]|nr:hypothetical protein [Saprospiraceae bacterium]
MKNDKAIEKANIANKLQSNEQNKVVHTDEQETMECIIKMTKKGHHILEIADMLNMSIHEIDALVLGINK